MNLCGIMRKYTFCWRREERGSGLQFATACSEDVLDRNWQRPDSDPSGRKASQRSADRFSDYGYEDYPSGGEKLIRNTRRAEDFRQATYRAVRQGLMKAQSALLEPYYSFRMEMPAECVGRAMTDVQRMYGTFDPPQTEETRAVLCGSVPVSAMGRIPDRVCFLYRRAGQTVLYFKRL